MLPFFPGHEFHANSVIVDSQITVPAAMNRIRCALLNLLRHHPDIDRVIAALVTEAVELKPVSELRNWDDAFLEPNVGTAPTAASAAAAAATATAAHAGAAAARSSAAHVSAAAAARPSTATELRTTTTTGPAAAFEIAGPTIA